MSKYSLSLSAVLGVLALGGALLCGFVLANLYRANALNEIEAMIGALITAVSVGALYVGQCVARGQTKYIPVEPKR